MNAYLTPAATAAIKAANAAHIQRNNARRLEREFARLMNSVRVKPRDLSVFRPSQLLGI